MNNACRSARNVMASMIRQPGRMAHLLGRLPFVLRGQRYAESLTHSAPTLPAVTRPAAPNPLWEYFEAHREGPGIWKWRHYFDIYHRHFSKFIGTDVHIVEVGVYSGGSMQMWRDYFGPRCKIFGVDIEPACKAYEAEDVRIFIGDQEDRGFWRRFRQEVPRVDIVIDDGGHHPEQQTVTLEEMLPHVQPGGVFLCEDIAPPDNGFGWFMHGMTGQLNRMDRIPGGTKVLAAPLQQWIGSVSCYPYLTVIEKREAHLAQLPNLRRGTQWQPFYEPEYKAGGASTGAERLMSDKTAMGA